MTAPAVAVRERPIIHLNAAAAGHAAPLADTDKAGGSAPGAVVMDGLSQPTTEAALSQSTGGPIPPVASPPTRAAFRRRTRSGA